MGDHFSGCDLIAISVSSSTSSILFSMLQVIENAFFPNTEDTPTWRHILVTSVVSILVLVISLSTDCLGIVLELNVSMVN